MIAEEQMIGAIRAWTIRMATDMGITFLSVNIAIEGPAPFIHIENIMGLHISNIYECINTVKDRVELTLDLLNIQSMSRPG